jgi:hypothetical protein
MCYAAGHYGRVQPAYSLWRRGLRWMADYKICYAVGWCGGVPRAYGLWRRGLQWIVDYKMCNAVGYCGSVLPAYSLLRRGLRWVVDYKICYVARHYGSVQPMEKGFMVDGGLQDVLCSRDLRRYLIGISAGLHFIYLEIMTVSIISVKLSKLFHSHLLHHTSCPFYWPPPFSNQEFNCIL